MEEKIRLAKRIAESGVASRREAERLIGEGCVTVDGQIVKTPVFFVTDQNEVSVRGKIIPQKSEEVIIWKYHKPAGVITTKSDPQHRETVFSGKNFDQRFIYIGRLDYNSEGLLLFTNNGKTAEKMELPSTGLKRVYRVRIFGDLTEEKIQKLGKGVTINGIRYRPADIKIDRRAANSWITVTISEGKNREIRKMMSYVGCEVSRLIRISYGPFNLGNLPPGSIETASEREMAQLEKSGFFVTTQLCQ
ncbi:MAG: rRNA pseudouridine synthase [Holosporaceae bacterium]|nr:rRNA pseudouridine synthase [Holosporaceae bacterium]